MRVYNGGGAPILAPFERASGRDVDEGEDRAEEAAYGEYCMRFVVLSWEGRVEVVKPFAKTKINNGNILEVL